MRALFFTIALLWGLHIGVKAQKVADLSVKGGPQGHWNAPISLNVGQNILQKPGKSLVLYEISTKAKREIPVQLLQGDNPQLCWLLDGETAPGVARTFELHWKDVPEASETPIVTTVMGMENLGIVNNGREVLNYRHAVLLPPEGQSPLYQRSGFIHPLRSPSGAVLTRVQPPDHYHHVGLWNPWTRVIYKGQLIDFWNLVAAEGTVEFADFISRIHGPVVGGFKVLHNHVDLRAKTTSGRETALKEIWEVQSWNLGEDGSKYSIVDVNSTYNCATDSSFSIMKYRYQGFGLRGRANWNDENCILLTSEGKDKANGNATRARWCDVNGPTEAGTSGILFMTNPVNYDYPELLRIWPTGTNEGKENVFFNFNPAQDKHWKMLPGNTYILKYRMLVYDGKIDAELAERVWNDFAFPPVVEINYQ